MHRQIFPVYKNRLAAICTCVDTRRANGQRAVVLREIMLYRQPRNFSNRDELFLSAYRLDLCIIDTDARYRHCQHSMANQECQYSVDTIDSSLLSLSVRCSINSTGWKIHNGSTSTSSSLLTSVCMVWHPPIRRQTFTIVNVFDQPRQYHWRPSHAAPFRRRSGISGCCRSYLEQSASPRHLGILCTSLQSSSENQSLLTVLLWL